MRSPVIIGNWKLFGNKDNIEQLLNEIKDQIQTLPQQIAAVLPQCKIAVCPPAPYFSLVESKLADSTIMFGAQNVDIHTSGAFTGEIAADMLQNVGIKYVIVGHSERRHYHDETDTLIAEKFIQVKKTGLIPVLCIGESAQQRANGNAEATCIAQLKPLLTHAAGIEALFTDTIIAYEPIWAIGSGQSATPQQAQAMHAAIRQYIGQYDKIIAQNLIIQYGGSVNNDNAAALFEMPDIDGALIGGASLKAATFVEIIKAALTKKCL